MKKIVFLLIMSLLILLVVVGCGIPKEAYDDVVAERNAALAELKTVKSGAQSSPAPPSVTAPPASALTAYTMSSLAKRLDLAEKIFTFESTRHQAMKAKRDGNEEESKKLYLSCVSLLKSFDAPVKEIADAELSRDWAEMWGQNARQASEQQQQPVYNWAGY